jgi:hypothetical protein
LAAAALSNSRWVASGKAAVVAAVRHGRITMEEALRGYQLTEEEFLSWQRAFESHGLPGLRPTRVQQHRQPRWLRTPRKRPPRYTDPGQLPPNPRGSA